MQHEILAINRNKTQKKYDETRWSARRGMNTPGRHQYLIYQNHLQLIVKI